MINPNTPFLNRDGTVSREWLMFFYALSNAVGGINDQPDLTSLLATMDENFSATIEIEKALDAQRAALALDDALWPRLAEIQKLLSETQVQMTLQAGGFAHAAQLVHRLDDLELALAFMPSLDGLLVANNNLSDVPDATKARSNLGLGSIATQPYAEGTWTPTVGSLTVVSGTPAYAGVYTKVGRRIFFNIEITGGNTTSTANTTTFTLPFTPARPDVCFVAGSGDPNYGTGAVWTDGKVYPPAWTNANAPLAIAGSFDLT